MPGRIAAVVLPVALSHSLLGRFLLISPIAAIPATRPGAEVPGAVCVAHEEQRFPRGGRRGPGVPGAIPGGAFILHGSPC
jgi:hypothetical protein